MAALALQFSTEVLSYDITTFIVPTWSIDIPIKILRPVKGYSRVDLDLYERSTLLNPEQFANIRNQKYAAPAIYHENIICCTFEMYHNSSTFLILKKIILRKLCTFQFNSKHDERL